MKYIVSFCNLIFFCQVAFSQVSDEEIVIRYTGEDKTANTGFHDGQMRPAIGVQNYQILRANRSYPEMAGHLGWTYNHAPMLAYWNGYFLCHYLSTPMGEHDPPGVTLMAKSEDGMNWDKPDVIFPVYYTSEGSENSLEITYHFMHQRMGFYVSPGNRLLVMGFYGGNNGDGIGRVVREVYRDFSLGPLYFIRVNDNWEGELKYPDYHESPDEGFIEACEAFLHDRIRRIQWWEENSLAADADTFYMPYEREKAFCFYTHSDSLIIGFFKGRMITYTRDEGKTWKEPFRAETLTYGGAKIWGQKLDNGQFALVYNPTDNRDRHPLCVAVSDDGFNFNDLAVVHGEVPVKRYWGIEKRPGPQYVRGIVEGNGNPPGDDLWVIYSVSKEDIWISRIPVPVERTIDGPVKDNFDEMETGSLVKGWNIYSPRWCPVRIAEFPDKQNKSLMLKDFDPYDYAKAVRVFGQADRQRITFDFFVMENRGRLHVEMCDKNGHLLVQTNIDQKGSLQAIDGPENMAEVYDIKSGEWITFSFDINSEDGVYDIIIDGKSVGQNLKFLHEGTAERIEFRTGEYRLDRKIQEYKSGSKFLRGWDEPAPGEKDDESEYYIRDFRTEIVKMK